mmetsp:Transcript_62247/g.157258  ORF Transcript_62247/g.157258 Transcript_62247/m.157258 type:complete len:796 (-) Transcript_62247:507-2894(-)
MALGSARSCCPRALWEALRGTTSQPALLRPPSSGSSSAAVAGACGTVVSSRRGFAGLRQKKEAQAEKLAALPEVRHLDAFRTSLAKETFALPDSGAQAPTFHEVGLSNEDVQLALDAGLATFLLHVQSRVANHCGEGFYTIGPCGEELLAGVGLALEPSDAAALHYRHLSTALVRAMRGGKPMEQVLLDRARGFCVSAQDPVGGGHHCLLGGSPSDFLVTSTLASQSPPAVGRAAGLRLAHHLKIERPLLPPNAVSYVSLGDGSVNNAHFLSAVNMAEYMQHRGFQCPVVFGISDNGLCISLRGHEWLNRFVQQRLGMPVFHADGNSLASVYAASRDATRHARRRGGPAAIVFGGLRRRFGHAATDRQDAYLAADEIAAAEAHDALAGECARAVAQGVTSYAKLQERFEELASQVEAAFEAAAEEPKVASREACIRFNSQPLVPKAEVASEVADKVNASTFAGKASSAPQVMRRVMTRALDEQLSARKELVYVGEDVQHGGYYRITDGLHSKHGWRVADFPPDETSLLGVAIGYSQAGLLPIVEIPYAKYLDCGGDMFFEAVIMNWLSAGQRPSGMIIRLQGFDKGVFGGNFHTHNSLHLPPGLDVVAFSNGADYARGLRNAVAQAAAGRVVMLVDSTDLLNRRHLFEKDDAWMTPYPVDPADCMAFDEVRAHGEGDRLLIVSYGNGVPTSLRAQRILQEEHAVSGVVVVDAPYLSDVPGELAELIPRFSAVLFADVCKMGQHPQAGQIVRLQERGLLPAKWRSIAATPTYNPLGSTLTFLNETDIIQGALAVLR